MDGDRHQDATKNLFVNFTTGTLGNDTRNATHGVRAVRQADMKNPQVPQCGTASKCIFVTSKVSTANLGGLAGADAICNTLATNAGLPGTYVAWLSDDSTDAVSRVTSDGPYQTRGGDVVASSKADLIDGSLGSPIDEDEYGPIPLREVYTNSYADGTGSGIGYSCLNWTDGTAANITPVGRTDSTTTDWTYVFDQFCDRNNSIVCIHLVLRLNWSRNASILALLAVARCDDGGSPPAQLYFRMHNWNDCEAAGLTVNLQAAQAVVARTATGDPHCGSELD